MQAWRGIWSGSRHDASRMLHVLMCILVRTVDLRSTVPLLNNNLCDFWSWDLFSQKKVALIRITIRNRLYKIWYFARYCNIIEYRRGLPVLLSTVVGNDTIFLKAIIRLKIEKYIWNLYNYFRMLFSWYVLRSFFELSE